MKIKALCWFLIRSYLTVGLGWFSAISAENQTLTTSKVHIDSNLPFRVLLEKADFELPVGVQSYIHSIVDDKWLIITGRVGGLHGFVFFSTNNFPIYEQNTSVFVVDPINKQTYTRSLLDPQSGLTQAQVDLLSVTAAQGYQSGNTLYITGGYGVDTASGALTTKNSLTAIDIPGLMHWVTNPSPGETAAQHIRQIFDDTFKVTGGYMNQTGDNPTLLMVGHDFDGYYHFPTQQPPVFQQYTEQVRRFFINDDGVNLSFTPVSPLPAIPDPNLRRRDLNVVPVVKKSNHKLENGFSILSGVFTLTDGVWTVPVDVTADGNPSYEDASLPSTFKQGMSNYDCATFGMFSENCGEMYVILLGGMSYGFFEKDCDDWVFKTDYLVPFISQTTAITIDKHGKYTQYFMPKGGFPPIRSKTVNKGNTLLFGSEAEVLLLGKTPRYSNDVIKLDEIKKPTVIGYVVGGIESTSPNPGAEGTQADSLPSQYIFKVIVVPFKDVI